MNLEHRIKDWFATQWSLRLFLQRRRTHRGEVSFGQTAGLRLNFIESFMSSLLFARRAAICFCWGLALGFPAAVFAQTNYYTTNGTEYAIIGSLPGDQVFPDVALNASGGFVVWQDNVTDGSGWGVSAQRLDGMSGTFSPFRVNVQGTNDQENPRVALLKNGGAVFAWQGGQKGMQQVFARFLTPTNTWLTTNDVLVGAPLTTNVFLSHSYLTNTTSTIKTNKVGGRTTYTTNTTTKVTTVVATNLTLRGNFQIKPAVATLANSNVVVVWSAFDQAGSNSLQDVYGQFFSQAGQKIGTNFLVNQFIPYNQRTPAVAALKNGGFVVAWVSEQERAAYNSGVDNTNGSSPSLVGLPSVDIYARLYTSNGVASGNEFLVNVDSKPCANPAVAAAADGSFMVAWGEKDLVVTTNSWDIYARSFTNASGGAVVRVNTHLYGDQYVPSISAIGGDYMIVWTSLGQDGSREGVFGQSVHEDGSLVGGEFQVNTTTAGQQMQPAVASDGAENFLVVWTSYTFSPNGFDLFAQRYINVNGTCNAMGAPFVWAPFLIVSNRYQPQLQVSWPLQLGLSISNYEIYVNGLWVTNVPATSNAWTMTAANGLTVSSTNWFQVTYLTTAGCQPVSLSPSTMGATWSGLNWGGIPYEWMAEYFGGYSNGKYTTNYWPSASTLLASGGPTIYQVFLSGGSPLDPGTWLQTTLTRVSQGSNAGNLQPGMTFYLGWNTQPGLTYQVQVTTDFNSWSNLGSPRFASGYNDSIYVGSGSAAYYRVLLLRQ